jgi:hypothetical protein
VSRTRRSTSYDEPHPQGKADINQPRMPAKSVRG